jgi:hypothetical protein
MAKTLLTLACLLVPFHVASAQSASSGAAWYERLQFSGDFRSRYEGFYREGDETRNRARLRLRLRLDTAINDDARLGIQVASGDPGTPVSTNQTFTGFFTPKPLSLDRAFLAYNPRAASAMTLGIGRFASPVSTTQMLFDEDLNFEGGWEAVSWSPREGVDIALVGLQTAVNELSSRADSFMVAGYGEVGLTLGAHRLQLSAANYGWGNADQIAVAVASDQLDSILTNAVIRNAAGDVLGFVSAFNVVDVMAEATFDTGTPAYPLRIAADLARNTRSANDRNTGLWLEVEYGAPRPTGTWGAGYTYGWIEQDVTPSAFVFSDMPGTNLRLHILEGSYVLKAGLSLDATLHVSRRLVPEPASDPNRWLRRLHLAVVARF